MVHALVIALFALLCGAWAVLQLLAPSRDGEGHTGCWCRTGRPHRSPGPAATPASRDSDTDGTRLTGPTDTLDPSRRVGSARRWIALAITVLVIGAGGWFAFHTAGDDSAVPQTLAAERFLMGTLWSIRVTHLDGPSRGEVEAAMEAAFVEVARIEALMSEFDPDSPLSRLNAAAGGDPVAVPAELGDLIARSIEYGRRSQGAFDITWRGMAPLWHFDDRDFVPPSPDAVDQARRLVDYRRIVVDGDRVGLPETGMAVGLGGVAKGYAIDRAAEVLRAAGIENFFVDGGGDVLVQGSRGNGPWRVGVRHPRGGLHQLLAVVHLDRGAVVTSGDYERFREVDGVRFHHIIDPRTGWPARLSMAVTVVAPTAEAADALATAAFVLGPEAGLPLIEAEEDTEALWIDPGGRITMTEGFQRLVRTH